MIIANMATFPTRKDIVIKVIQSLHKQVDLLNLCLNEFTSIPKEYAKFSKLNPIIPNKDYKDVGKFIHPIVLDASYILVDDDIIYPPNYVAHLQYFYEKFKNLNIVVGTHGVIYSDIYNGSFKARKVFSFRQALDKVRVVNQLGTGTVFLKGYQLPSLSYMEGSQKYVDVRFSKYLYENNISLLCVPREANWQKEITVEDSIFSSFTKKWPSEIIREVQVISGYSKLRFSVVKQIELDESISY